MFSMWPHFDFQFYFTVPHFHAFDLRNGRFGIPQRFVPYILKMGGSKYMSLLNLTDSYSSNQTIKQVLKDLTDKLIQVEKVLEIDDILHLFDIKENNASSFFSASFHMVFRNLTHTDLPRLRYNDAYPGGVEISDDFISSTENLTMRSVLSYKYNNTRPLRLKNERTLLFLTWDNIFQFLLGKMNNSDISSLLNSKYNYYRTNVTLKYVSELYGISRENLFSKPMIFISTKVIGLTENEIRLFSSLDEREIMILKSTLINDIQWILMKNNVINLSLQDLEYMTKKIEVRLYFTLFREVLKSYKNQNYTVTLSKILSNYHNLSAVTIADYILKKYNSSSDKTVFFEKILLGLELNKYLDVLRVDFKLYMDRSVKQLLDTIYASKFSKNRNSHPRFSLKKCVLKNFAKFTGKHLARISFLIKLQVFLCEYCDIFRDTFFREHLLDTASEIRFSGVFFDEICVIICLNSQFTKKLFFQPAVRN